MKLRWRATRESTSEVKRTKGRESSQRCVVLQFAVTIKNEVIGDVGILLGWGSKSRLRHLVEGKHEVHQEHRGLSMAAAHSEMSRKRNQALCLDDYNS